MKRKKSDFTLVKCAAHAGISKNFSHTAFTLAEVLITLGIIGVVAAMTLPAVINNSRNKQLEAGLKRSYSVISQALDQYQAETGERITVENQGTHTLKPILMKYLKTVQDCGFGTDNKACIPNKNYLPEEDKADAIGYRTYNGKTEINMAVFDDGQFVLNDGSLILIENVLNPDLNRLYISVDVNGYNKNPNRLGQDLFMFQIDSKGTLLPMGAKGTNYYNAADDYCSPASTTNLNGAGCTYKALTDKNYFKNLPK